MSSNTVAYLSDDGQYNGDESLSRTHDGAHTHTQTRRNQFRPKTVMSHGRHSSGFCSVVVVVGGGGNVVCSTTAEGGKSLIAARLSQSSASTLLLVVADGRLLRRHPGPERGDGERFDDNCAPSTGQVEDGRRAIVGAVYVFGCATHTHTHIFLAVVLQYAGRQCVNDGGIKRWP